MNERNFLNMKNKKTNKSQIDIQKRLKCLYPAQTLCYLLSIESGLYTIFFNLDKVERIISLIICITFLDIGCILGLIIYYLKKKSKER